MKWHSYHNAAQFLASVGAYLEQREAESNLALGLLYSLAEGRRGIEQAAPLMAAVENSGRPVLVLVMTPPNQLVIADIESGSALLEAIRIAVESLAALGVAVPGVIGDPDTASAFAQAWEGQNGCSSEVVMNQRIYRLDHVNEVPRGPGDLRIAKEADTELVANWIREFSVEVDIGEPMPYDTAVRKAGDSIGERSLYLWEDHGEPVSMAKRARPTRHGVVISLVYTPPALRGKGYATSCVASLSQLLLEEGYQFCSLYTDLSNPTSNHIYQNIGYKPVRESVDLRFIQCRA